MKRLLTTICLIILSLAAYAQPDSLPRVVSMTPNLTEIVCALGRGDCLVGRSDACDYPVSVKKLPTAGKFGIPNTEQVLQLKPDLIITSALKDKAEIKKYKAYGIKIHFLPYEKMEDYFTAIKKLGELLNCRQKASKLIVATRKKLKFLKLQAEKKPLAQRPKILLALHDSPLMTVGNKSYINDMIKYAGGVNIAEKFDRSYFNCSLEWVVINQPDILLMPGQKAQKVNEIMKQPGWRSIKAVKNKQVYYNLNPDLIYRLGPRTISGIEQIKAIIDNRKKP
jgi:iron complex transport system substrate-binding protein